MIDPKFDDLGVKAVFAAYPLGLRKCLLALRRMIFRSAAKTEGVGDLLETLKWHQPAYRPVRPKIGSTIRIGGLKCEPNKFAMLFHCQTTLVATFREIYPDNFAFQGNRAIVFRLDDPIPEDALQHCITMALTYHLRSRRAGARAVGPPPDK